MLSSPTPFKPTLVSDYFFTNPPSPIPPLDADAADGVVTASSPEVESPSSGSSELRHKRRSTTTNTRGGGGGRGEAILETDPSETTHMDLGSEAEGQTPAGDPNTTQPLSWDSAKPAALAMVAASQAVPGIGSPTQPVQHLVATNDPYAMAPVSLGVGICDDVGGGGGGGTGGGGHSNASSTAASPVSVGRVHQALLAAAMPANSPMLPTYHPDPDSRKGSVMSVMSLGPTPPGSAPSTAPPSNSNSPTSRQDHGGNSMDQDTTMSSSGSNSTAHTPSPPPLTLPAAAVAAPEEGTSSVLFTSPHFGAAPGPSPPATTPARYRTVPAVQVPSSPAARPNTPPHQVEGQLDMAASAVAAAPSSGNTSPAFAPNHPPPSHQSQTPRHPSSRRHLLPFDHVPACHSNPATPPTHSKAHPSSAHMGMMMHHHHAHHHHHHLHPHGRRYHHPPHVHTINGVEYVGPFILGPVLGSGCTGTVRLGTHKRTGFKVAFKIIERKYLQQDPKLWAKVKREIAILKLVEHPHVLKLYDVLETEEKLYLVLEHVKGGELFDFIVSKGRLDRHESLRLAAQIIMGLEHCHLLNISHRDLKPENLLLDDKHCIKLADFGLAQIFRPNGILRTSCGSPHYASPEIINGDAYDAKSTDVWSLGVILYALITGSLPFDHDNIPTLLGMVTRGHYTTPSHVPQDVAHLISRMLTVNPAQRITIPEIKKHAAFRGFNYFHLEPTASQHPGMMPSLSGAFSEHQQRLSLTHHMPTRTINPNANGGSSSNAAAHGAKKQRSSMAAGRGGVADDSDDEGDGGAWWKARSNSVTTPPSSSAAAAAAACASAACHHDAKDCSPPHRSPFLPLAPPSLRPAPVQVGGGDGDECSSSSPEELDVDAMDEGVLNDLESLGLGGRDGNREELKNKIRTGVRKLKEVRENSSNACASASASASAHPSANGNGKELALEAMMYQLLRKRKEARLKELAVLSPKVSPMPTPTSSSRTMMMLGGERRLLRHHSAGSASGAASPCLPPAAHPLSQYSSRYASEHLAQPPHHPQHASSAAAATSSSELASASLPGSALPSPLPQSATPLLLPSSAAATQHPVDQLSQGMGMVALTLPPPHPRSSPAASTTSGCHESQMSDVCTSDNMQRASAGAGEDMQEAAALGTSLYGIMQSNTTGAQNSSGALLLQSSIFAGCSTNGFTAATTGQVTSAAAAAAQAQLLAAAAAATSPTSSAGSPARPGAVRHLQVEVPASAPMSAICSANVTPASTTLSTSSMRTPFSPSPPNSNQQMMQQQHHPHQPQQHHTAGGHAHPHAHGHAGSPPPVMSPPPMIHSRSDGAVPESLLDDVFPGGATPYYNLVAHGGASLTPAAQPVGMPVLQPPPLHLTMS